MTPKAGAPTHHAFPVGTCTQGCTQPAPAGTLHTLVSSTQMNGAPRVVQHAGPSCTYVEKELRFLITLGKCPEKIWS